MRPLLALVITLALATFVWTALNHVPGSFYWRDSGEFVLSAYFLDIAHPGGFPTYAQLANLPTLLPIGPIPWRVNLFSTLLGLTLVVQVLLITRAIAKEVFNRSERVSWLSGVVAAALLLTVPVLTTQSLTAEVYVLNAVICAALLWLYHKYLVSRDLRFLLTACFVGGVGLGNHLALGIVLLLCGLFALTEYSKVRRVLLPGLLVGLFGCLVYLFLPVRADPKLPMNTGFTYSAERLVFHLTNSRSKSAETSAQETKSDEPATTLSLEPAAIALGRLMFEVPMPFLTISLVGLAALFAASIRLGTIILLLGVGSWWPFFRWHPDPWITLFFLIALCCGLFVAAVPWLVKRSFSEPAALVVAAISVLGILISPTGARTKETALQLQDFDLASKTAAKILKPTAPNGILLAEFSWFPAATVHYIEGYRSDVKLVFTPRVLFPERSEPAYLPCANSAYDSFAFFREDRSSWSYPNMKSLNGLVQCIGATSPISFEPEEQINQLLSKVAILKAKGDSRIHYQQPGRVEFDYVKARLALTQALWSHLPVLNGAARYDTAFFMEGLATKHAHLVRQKDEPQSAVRLLHSPCAPFADSPCSSIALNNLGLYMSDSGDHLLAAILFARILLAAHSHDAVIKDNLSLVWSQLDQQQRQALLRNLGISVTEFEKLLR